MTKNIGTISAMFITQEKTFRTGQHNALVLYQVFEVRHTPIFTSIVRQRSANNHRQLLLFKLHQRNDIAINDFVAHHHKWSGTGVELFGSFAQYLRAFVFGDERQRLVKRIHDDTALISHNITHRLDFVVIVYHQFRMMVGNHIFAQVIGKLV